MSREERFDVVVVGNVGIDTNVFHPGGEIDFGAESNFTDNFDYVGQAGGYTSRGFAQLGLRTAFIGYVGDDFSGRFIREELACDRIDTTALFIDPAGTSRSVNLMFRDGTRKNFYDGKSHMHLRPDPEVCARILGRAGLAHFHIPNWARELLPMAKRLGMTISCDLQDVTSPEDDYRKDFIEYSDILFFSASNTQDPTALLNQFLNLGRDKIFIMGMGSRGCAVGVGGEACFYEPVELDEPVVDTNGAGDGLAVGFLSAFVVEGRPFEEAILRGQIVARASCAQKASTSALIRRERLEAYARRVEA